MAGLTSRGREREQCAAAPEVSFQLQSQG